MSAQPKTWNGGQGHTVLLTEQSWSSQPTHCMQSSGPVVTMWEVLLLVLLLGPATQPPGQVGSTCPPLCVPWKGHGGCYKGRKQATRGPWCFWYRAFCGVRKATCSGTQPLPVVVHTN